MTEARSLPIPESIRINTQRIKKMMKKLGEPAAQKFICSAHDEITCSLHAIQQSMARGDYLTALEAIDRLVELGWQIGLPSLAAVARNLRDCIMNGNETATAAVCCRLMRTGELSLVKIRQHFGLG